MTSFIVFTLARVTIFYRRFFNCSFRASKVFSFVRRECSTSAAQLFRAARHIHLCMYDLIEQQGVNIPIPEMPKELQLEQEKDQQEERTENAAQVYMRYFRDTREDQKQQRMERKRTGDMER